MKTITAFSNYTGEGRRFFVEFKGYRPTSMNDGKDHLAAIYRAGDKETAREVAVLKWRIPEAKRADIKVIDIEDLPKQVVKILRRFTDI